MTQTNEAERRLVWDVCNKKCRNDDEYQPNTHDKVRPLVLNKTGNDRHDRGRD